MEELNVTGRSFGSITTAIKLDNGDWEVKVNMLETRKVGDGEWETKELSAQCTDSSFEKAYSVAFTSVVSQFNDAVEITKSNSLFFNDK